jgi:predicted alpha/beta-hydrolase family hydrolase
LIDGPEAAPVTVLLAHGAGAAIDSPFTAAMASGLAGNWATAPGESSPRWLRSPLAAAAASEQDPPPHRTSIGASFVGFRLIAARIRPRNHSLLRIRRGLRQCDPAIGQH